MRSSSRTFTLMLRCMSPFLAHLRHPQPLRARLLLERYLTSICHMTHLCAWPVTAASVSTLKRHPAGTWPLSNRVAQLEAIRGDLLRQHRAAGVGAHMHLHY